MSDTVSNSPLRKTLKDSSEISYGWNIDLLGRLAVHRCSQPEDTVKRFQTSKTGAVLAFLAFHVGRDNSRETLIDQIWPDAEIEAGRHNLNQSLYSLRRQIEPPGTKPGTVLQSTHLYARLNPVAVTTDVDSFTRIIRQAENTDDPGERIALLLHAMDLYKGDLLPGYLDEWTLIERERLSLMYVECVKGLASTFEEQSRFDQAIGVLLKGTRFAPADEQICQFLLRLFDVSGKPERGIEHYVWFAKLLKKQEGRSTSSETKRLVEVLQAQCLKGKQRATGRTVGKRSSTKEKVPGSASSPAETADSAPSAPELGRVKPAGANLPARLTRFFGRQSELADLLARLSSGHGQIQNKDSIGGSNHGVLCLENRLISIIGPGGSGKTRLALEAVSSHVGRFDGQALFVPLADVSDPANIAPAILHSLNVRDIGNAEPLEQVIEALAGGECLLALDNLEHLLPAARSTIETLLQRLPLLRCLVTSQQAVLTEGEQEVPLSPLPLPELTTVPVDALQWDAVQLFADRARLVRPDFQITPRNAAVVCHICRQLDGIPLAVELAASRVQALSPAEVLEELTNRFGFLANRRKSDRRHRTLEDALGWSFDLLSPEGKKVFLQLSVFRAGCTLEAAKSVCLCNDIYASLEELVSRSLISRTDQGANSRYGMLETMRRFASGQLENSSAQQTIEGLYDRHAAYYCDLAIRREKFLRGKSSIENINELRVENDNINASLTRMTNSESGRVHVVEMAGSLWRYWYWTGALKEGRGWLERALLCVDAGFEDKSLKLFIGAGAITRLLGDMDVARNHLERGLSRCNDLCILDRYDEDLKLAMGELYLHLGILDDEIGESERAISHYEQAWMVRQGVLDQWGDAALLSNLGRAEQKLNLLDRAREHYRKAISLFEADGDWLQVAAAWNNLGAASVEAGDLAQGRAALESSRDIFVEQGNRWAATMPALNLGEVLQLMGKYEQANTELKSCLAIRRELGDKPGIPYCILNLGLTAVSLGDYVHAVHLLAAAQVMFNQVGTTLPPHTTKKMEADLQSARAQLGLSDFETAWFYGKGLAGERAVAYALNH